MGRKRLYDEDLAIKIHDLKSDGNTMREIGKILGMDLPKVRYVLYRVKPFKHRKLFKDLKIAMDEVDEKNNKMKKLLRGIQKKLLRSVK